MDSRDAAKAQVLIHVILSIRLAKAELVPSNVVCRNPDQTEAVGERAVFAWSEPDPFPDDLM